MTGILFVVLTFVVLPLGIWHYHRYFDDPRGDGECTYDRLAREQHERESA